MLLVRFIVNCRIIESTHLTIFLLSYIVENVLKAILTCTSIKFAQNVEIMNSCDDDDKSKIFHFFRS
jgi:hypothetical protein